jgi:hypothetical protein
LEYFVPFTALTGGTSIYYGTGTTTVYFQVANGSYSTGNIVPRNATINISNNLDYANTEVYTITQNVRTGNNTGVGWAYISNNPNP